MLLVDFYSYKNFLPMPLTFGHRKEEKKREIVVTKFSQIPKRIFKNVGKHILAKYC
jgi:hypothetical protein